MEVAFKKNKDDLAESVWTVTNITEQVFQCFGCERLHIFYREKSLNQDLHDEPIKYQLPKKVKRALPEWIKNTNIDYFELLSEIYSTYNNSNFISFSIVCRTLIDKILTDYLGDIGGFEKKLKQYKQQGHITKVQFEILTFLINSGNASAHRAYKPSEEISENLLDIIELILKENILHKKTQKHNNDIPKRKEKSFQSLS